MKFFSLTSFLCLTLFSLKAQQFDKRFLDEKVKQIDSGYKFRETLYVIEGLPYENYDSTKIDSVLSSNGLKYLLNIDILKETAAVNLISCRPIRDVILVSFAHKQRRSKKRTILKRVKQTFTDNYVSFSQHIPLDSKDPVLYIDNVLINHSEAKERVKGLTVKSIYHIDYNDKAVSTELYGQNAKNGFVRIWTIP
ncbi:MAG: hypothetical protein JSU03_06085 [Bacteroidetes bacterium]|nr:hypothetical protein [Bacteroidota bacterium]